MNDDDRLGAMSDIANLPEGAMPTAAFVLVSYIEADGSESFHWSQAGRWSSTDLIGCMTVAQHHLIAGSTFFDEDDDL